MTVTVLFFAQARDATGTAQWTCPPPPDVATLRDTLVSQFPTLAGILAVSRIAVNQDIALDSTTLTDGDEIAILPPYGGG
ncbi:MAG: MoaD/ThiS family protein [bacterium]